jgi:hypothetical protein
MRHSHRFKDRFIMFSVASMLFLAESCQKNEGESNTRSLDNFAQGALLHVNKCGASTPKKSYQQSVTLNVPDELSPSEREAMKSSFYTALSAVPEDLFRVASNLKAQVTLKTDEQVKKICEISSKNTQTKNQSLDEKRTVPASQGDRDFPACFFRNSSDSPLQIVMSLSKVKGKNGTEQYKFEHSIVRVFSYLATTHFDHFNSMPKANDSSEDNIEDSSELQKDVAYFSAVREELTDVYFRSDLRVHPSVDLFEQKYDGKNAAERLVFENAVLAEVFDSCYCSDNTRTSFKKKFPNTYKFAAKHLCSNLGSVEEERF